MTCQLNEKKNQLSQFRLTFTKALRKDLSWLDFNDESRQHERQQLKKIFTQVFEVICRPSRINYIMGSPPNFASNIKRISKFPFPLKVSENHYFSHDFRGNRSTLLGNQNSNSLTRLLACPSTPPKLSMISDWL